MELMYDARRLVAKLWAYCDVHLAGEAGNP